VLLASDIAPWLLRLIAFCFGAVWGSFFNVCIYRWPREMSVVTPPSHCGSCGKQIEAWRNLPIFGFLLLRGRTACCGEKLSPRYAIVETLTAVLCVAVMERWVVNAPVATHLWPAMAEAALYFFFVGGLIVATFVDLDFMEIPDEVSLPGAALGLVTVAVRSEPGAWDAAFGAGLGFLVIQVLFVWGYERILGRRGMGEGDSKLLMMIGAFLGWKGAIFALVGGAMQGLVAAGIMLATGRSLVPKIPERPWLFDPTVPVPKTLAEANAVSRAAEEAAEASARAAAESVAALAAPSSVTAPSTQPAPEAAPAEDSAAPAPALPAPSAPPVTPSTSERDTELEEGGLKMPYGPFLAVAALEYLFFGDEIVGFYLRLMNR
jgi:leader peptidase (prepilin peptidase)/N-methyltransferase